MFHIIATEMITADSHHTRHVTSPECPRTARRKHSTTAPRLLRRKAWIGLFPPRLGREPQCLRLVLPRFNNSERGQAPALPSAKTFSTGSKVFGTTVAQDNPTQEEYGKYLTSYVLLLSQVPLLPASMSGLDASLSEILEMRVTGLTNLFSFHWIPIYNFQHCYRTEFYMLHNVFSRILTWS